jgi:hypothetical protein
MVFMVILNTFRIIAIDPSYDIVLKKLSFAYAHWGICEASGKWVSFYFDISSCETILAFPNFLLNWLGHEPESISTSSACLQIVNLLPLHTKSSRMIQYELLTELLKNHKCTLELSIHCFYWLKGIWELISFNEHMFLFHALKPIRNLDSGYCCFTKALFTRVLYSWLLLYHLVTKIHLI